MKRVGRKFGCWFRGSCLLVVLGTAAAPAFVQETATEFHAVGDFDGDGRNDVVLVDKASGGYRIGYQLSPGDYTWADTRASGVQNVTGVSVGRLLAATRDALAVTGPEANRVNLLEASSPSAAGLPVAVFIPSLGPNLVAAVDIGGVGNTPLHDLFVGSMYNGAAAYRYSTVRNTDGLNFNLLTDAGVTALMQRANRVSLKSGTPDRVGVIFRGTTDIFRAYDLSSGTPIQNIIQNLPAGSEYAVGRFASGNPLSQFLFYQPGSPQLVRHQVQEPAPGTFNLAAGTAFHLGQKIQQVRVVSGAAAPRLLVIFGSGEIAAVYDFDGVNPPVLLQSFMPSEGELFSGAAVLDGGHFMLYSGAPGAGVSAQFQIWNFNGVNFTAGAAGALPFLSQQSASGNVLLFRNEPFVHSNPGLVRVLNAGDWASTLAYTGSPPVVTVWAEHYAGPTQGLGNPSVTAMGVNPPLANFGLVNQYSNAISVFSFQPAMGDAVAEVKIAPNPGNYATAIEFSLTTTDPTHLAFYRFGNGAWQGYSVPVRVFTNATIQYYAKPPSGNNKSAIHTARYTFNDTPAQLDSDGDGVPDFVELGKGLDPLGGADSDEDGYSDLEELLRGTDPNSAASVPTNAPRVELNTAFDRAVTPRPYDGPNNVTTYAATGTALRVYAPQGGLLAAATVAPNVFVAGVTNPAGRLTNIAVLPEDRLLVEATELHYDILTSHADKRIGRELVGLLVAPQFAPVQIPYVFGGGNLTTEANAWIQAASNAYAGLTREISRGDLTINDTLAAALVERKIGQILTARGLHWGTNITLFPFRPSDVGRSNVTQALLLSLEKETTNGLPAFRLQTMYQTISNLVEQSSFGAIINLRAVAHEIYDICSTHNNANPAHLTPPLDQLRRFLAQCSYDANYLAHASFTNLFASACAGAAMILDAVPPRPVTNVTVVATASAPHQAADGFALLGSGVSVELWKADGRRYDLPDSFGVVPGSQLQVRGYTDVSDTPSRLVLEVLSVRLTSIPLASDADQDGNLLVDSWEKLFFGDRQDPFGDWDGDGYTNLQEMFEQSDPNDPLGLPAVPVAALGPPAMELIPDGAQIRLRFQWPAQYLNRVQFGVKSSADLGAPFDEVPAAGPLAVFGSPHTWDLIVSTPLSPSHFYLLYLTLR
ncbi:MAG TPA: thrombospondin type 3 repeat-containing protein [Verrucomicrobiota bacterium]|nr:thrombospondin type 3 repeat-containing protein [Verrucomicrobiota bacterium]HQB17978.1 thrombospondin type 3 repeat-containing protein [Verrucomicrobiota bacterium]